MTVARRAAKRPKPRTVTVVVTEGDFEGWEATARVDFPARILGDLQSGSVDRLITALEAIVIEHNMPSSDGTIAEHLIDVDPYAGLLKIGGDVLDAIGKLPNR